MFLYGGKAAYELSCLSDQLVPAALPGAMKRPSEHARGDARRSTAWKMPPHMPGTSAGLFQASARMIATTEVRQSVSLRMKCRSAATYLDVHIHAVSAV